MLTNILCLPGLTAAQTAWTDIAWFGFSMGTLFPIILALLGVVPYTVVVGICAVAHILGTLVRAWLRECWKVFRAWQES